VRHFHADETRADDDGALRARSDFHERIGVSETTQDTNVLQIRARNIELARLAAGRHEQRVVVQQLAAVERDRLRARVNARHLFVTHEFDVAPVVKLIRPERHPRRLGVALQVIFAQVRAVVRGAVFACDQGDTTAKAILAESLRRRVTGCAAADDDEAASVCVRVVFCQRRNPPVLLLDGETGEDAPVSHAHVVTHEGIERGRLFHVARRDVEAGVMPGAHHARAAERAFDERRAVVRTGRADGVEVVADARQQDFRLARRDFFHLAVAEVGGVSEGEFLVIHNIDQATFVRCPIFSFLVLR
jgi:hypothetical protein